MSYFSEWNREIERVTKEGKSDDFVRAYYHLEQKAYEQILAGYPDSKWSGSFAELQQTLGFADQPLIFAGFLEGINESLETPLDLDSLTDESQIVLSIQFEKLLYNMYDAKAHWLYDLPDWDKVMPREQRLAIAKKYRTDHIAVSNKVGRNDPCVCGSGKKFKNCCGR